MHPGDVPTPVLRSVLRQAELSEEQWGVSLTFRVARNSGAGGGVFQEAQSELKGPTDLVHPFRS